MGRILDGEQAAGETGSARKAGRVVVFTNGCFDILHVGHVRYLREARSFGDMLVVGLNSDRSIRALKGPGRPIVPGADRAEVLASLDMVDIVTLFDEETPLDLIRRVRPHVLVKGGDYREEDVVGRDVVVGIGGRVRIVPFHPGWSSSRILDRIRRLEGEGA